MYRRYRQSICSHNCQGTRSSGITNYRYSPSAPKKNLHAGVLTKADTVLDDEYESWLNIMNGRSHTLHHGYYMTRLPANLKEMQKHGNTRERRNAISSPHVSRGTNWISLV